MKTPAQKRVHKQMIIACTALAGAIGLAIIAMLAVTEQLPQNSNAENFIRKLQIRDGDTLNMQGGQRIRLLCIDAPEQDQPGGLASKNELKSLVSSGATIRDLGKDFYGRMLAVASIGGKSKRVIVNVEMIRRGHAWVYRRYANDCGIPRKELCAAEREARSARLGLWRDPNPIPPWRWRQGKTRPSNRLPACDK